MSSLQPVGVTRLYRMIADQIKGKIEAGHFKTGARLPSERELAEVLEVSRASVREALIALEIEGYVDVRVGTGVFVTYSSEDARAGTKTVAAAPQPDGDIGAFDLLEARLLVEPQCAALAAVNATETHLAVIRETVRDMQGGERQGDHDRAFHIAIASACGNTALASTVAHLCALRESSAIFSRLDQHFVTGKVWEVAHDEHLTIMNAILARDADAARNAMHAHLAGVRDRLHQDFCGNAVLAGNKAA